MATLYEIDQAITDCVDLETGEILDIKRLEQLQLDRTNKIENVALWYKNLVSDADAIKTERKNLEEREKALRSKAESLKSWLSDALNGEKMNTPKVSLTFRKSEAVEIEDSRAFIDWAQTHLRDDLLTYSEPSPNKTKIKDVIKQGIDIVGAKLVSRTNISIK